MYGRAAKSAAEAEVAMPKAARAAEASIIFFTVILLKTGRLTSYQGLNLRQFVPRGCYHCATAKKILYSTPLSPMQVVVVNSQRVRGWVEEKAMGAARKRLLAYLRAADRYGRFRIYRPVTANGAPIYVHAKVLAADERLLRIGSANLNNRSMGLDTECDLAIEAYPGSPAAEVTTHAISEFRNGLLAEHLATDPGAVRAALSAGNSSLISVIEALRRESGRTLIPIELPPAQDGPFGEGELLDPEQAEPLWLMLFHSIQDRVNRTR